MKLYLAGPMSNKPYFNYPLFDSVSKALREQGYDITSPAEMDDTATREEAMENEGGIPGQHESGETWGDFLARDVKMIADELEGIVLLPDWQTSKGARLEVFVALNLGYPIYEYHEKLSAQYPEHLQGCAQSYIMEKINESLL